MHGVTNRLLEASRVATAGDRAGAVKLLNELLDFHVRTARALCAPAAAAACADGLSADASTVRAALGTLADAADAVSSVGAGERVKGHYAADAVACAGEQWSARIMATQCVRSARRSVIPAGQSALKMHATLYAVARARVHLLTRATTHSFHTPNLSQPR